MDFKIWILKFIGVELPIGDLAKHIAQDDDFPSTTNYKELFNHIHHKNYHSDALFVFERVYKFYRADEFLEGY